MTDEEAVSGTGSISLRQLLAWIGTAVVVVATGTFVLTRLSMESQVAALRTQLDDARTKASDDAKRVAASAQKPPSSLLPVATVSAASDEKTLAPLAERINQLEAERQALLQDLIRQSKDALDPSSELAVLVNQLSSPDVAVRRQGVLGLFDLRDPKSIPSLLNYLRSHPEEAIEAPNPDIYDWFSLLWRVSPETAAEFSVQQLESPEKYTAKWAYRYLYDSDLPRADIERLQLPLKALALRSPNSLARTRAKLLLQAYADRLAGKQQSPDSRRSMMDVLLDIEQDVKALKPVRPK